MKAAVGIVLILIFSMIAGVWSFAAWRTDFNATRDCLAYVDRAAHAPNLDVAESSLDTAISAAEGRGWTSGNTGVIWTQTYNDVGFWFDNLKRCREDVAAARKEGTQLTASNTLMRIRETLSRTPEGLTMYPNNVGWAVSGWIVWPVSLIVGAFGALLIAVEVGE